MKLLTVSNAAARLRRSEATVRRWADSGRLKVFARLADGSRLFRESEVVPLVSDDATARKLRASKTERHADPIEVRELARHRLGTKPRQTGQTTSVNLTTDLTVNRKDKG